MTKPPSVLTSSGYWLRLLSYTVANVLLVVSGRWLAPGDGYVAVLWLPAGLDFAVLWWLGWRYWPGAVLGPFIANGFFLDALVLVLGSAVANLAASLGAVGLAWLLLGRDPPYNSPRHAVLFSVVIATVPYAVAAGFGVLVLSFAEVLPDNHLHDFRAWWISDSAGLLMLAPLLIAFTQPRTPAQRGPALSWERELLAGVCVVAVVVVFAGRSIYEGDPLPGYLLLPPILWAGLRMGARETFLLVFVSNLATLIGVTFWYPVATAERSVMVLDVQIANIALAIVALLLVAAMHALRTALTERNQAQDRFRSAIEFAASGVAMVSPDGRVLMANPALCDMLGYSAQDIVGIAYAELVHPEEREQSLKTIARMVAGELQQIQTRKRFLARGGQTIWVLITVTLLRDEAGQPLHFIGHIQNIEQFKEIEDALAQSEARFRSLADTAPIGIYQLDLFGSALYANARWSEMSGYSFEQSQGLAWLQSLHPDDREQAIEHFRSARTAKRGTGFEFRFVRPDGNIVWCMTRISPMFDRAGELRGYVGSNEDITERRIAERAIRKLNDSLEQQVQQRTEQLAATKGELEAFTWSVSHDMRAPLRAIAGFASVLDEEERSRLSDQGKQYLQRIRASVSRLGDLINVFLELSRLSSGELRKREIDLSALAQEIVTELAAGQPERRVDIEIEPDLQLGGDPQQIRILLTNLLSNAWKFTSKTGAARIRFFAAPQALRITFNVQDNGIGFAMADADKLFTPFQRLHPRSEFDGAGIGLATCRRIVQRHGGQLWVYAEPGRGATFSFTVE